MANFYPMDMYKKKFGSPDDPEKKHLGHKKSKVMGVKGVIVPGDDDSERSIKLLKSTSTQTKSVDSINPLGDMEL